MGFHGLQYKRDLAAVNSFGVLLCTGALMPFVPGVNWGTFLFLAAYLCLLLPGNGIWLGATPSLRWRSFAILAFIGFCLVSLVWLLASGGQVGNWIRGIVPFLFLLSWFHLPSLNVHKSMILAKWILLATAVWGGRILIEAIWLAAGGSDVLSVRLTTRVTDSVLPYPLVALPLLLFCPWIVGSFIRNAGIAILLLLYLWIGYRGGLLIVGLMILLWLGTRRRVSFAWTLILLLLAGVVLSLQGDVLGTGFVGDLGARYSDLEGEREGVRALEWLYAIERWIEAPLIGKGLGWQVPAEVAFFGVDELPFEMPDSVGYVHSFVAYFLMSLGVVGLLSYLLCIWPRMPSWSGLACGRLETAASLAVILLIVFFLTQASFRQVQTTMLIVALMKIQLSRK